MKDDQLKNAVWGALVSVGIGTMTAGVGVAAGLGQIIGGATAGYLQGSHRRDAMISGAVAGALSTLVLVPFLALIAVFFLIDIAVSLVLLALGVIALLVIGLLNAGLGALGGILGGIAYEKFDEDDVEEQLYDETTQNEQEEEREAETELEREF